MNSYDVTALGELLIDFTESGLSKQGNPLLEVNPGGAPCNVLAMLESLGKKTTFVGKVGLDVFGKRLERAISKVGIDTSGLVKDKQVNTTLAFVHTLEDGDREFSFYRNPGADMMLREDEVKEELIKNSRIFHFGSLSMTNEICFKATEKAVKIARENGVIISFDPNLRAPLWDSLQNAKEKILLGIKWCDILKISDNEILWLTGEEDCYKAAQKLKGEYDIPLLLVSLGKNGSMAFCGESFCNASGFKVDTIETTGAGDTFCGCVLNFVLEHGFRVYSESELCEMLTFANAAAAIVTTRKGALAVMPSGEEIIGLLNS